MGTRRKLAQRILELVQRLAPEECREWVNAMLCELDFVDGEWSALFWATGSCLAVVRHAAFHWRNWVGRNTQKQEETVNESGRQAVGIFSGAGLALALALAMFGLTQIANTLFPGHDVHLANFIGAIVIPEIAFIVAAVMLWRRRPPLAAGIVLMAVAIGVHVVVHVTTR